MKQINKDGNRTCLETNQNIANRTCLKTNNSVFDHSVFDHRTIINYYKEALPEEKQTNRTKVSLYVLFADMDFWPKLLSSVCVSFYSSSYLVIYCVHFWPKEMGAHVISFWHITLICIRLSSLPSCFMLTDVYRTKHLCWW